MLTQTQDVTSGGAGPTGWKRAVVASVAALAVVLVGHSAGAARAQAGAAGAQAGAARAQAGAVREAGATAKVMVIAEENGTYGRIIGSSAAPYLNQLAATFRSVATVDA